MSRRHSQDRTLEFDPNVEVAWEHFEAGGIPWWYATQMPEPWDYFMWHQWLSAWGDVLLGVCKNVWRKEGAKLYAAHRDHELKADLEGWLVVRAMESARNFIPDPSHPNPHLQFASFLYRGLRKQARYHFSDTVGSGAHPAGRAAREAYSAGIASTEALRDAEEESGGHISRHPLHGEDWMAADPAQVLIRLEDLLEQVEEIEREDLGVTFYRSASETCLINLCTQPASSRGLCKSHYSTERRRSVDRGDWQAFEPAQGCTVDGCDRLHSKKGLCTLHYQRERKHGDPEVTVLRAPGGTCEEEGCGKPAKARGMCNPHYRRHRRATAPPCVVEGCDRRGIDPRGMCSPHYQQWRAARAAGEGDAYP